MGEQQHWPVSVVADGPVAVGAVLWRHRGEFRLTAIVKATMAFAPDGPMPVVEPDPIRLADEHTRGHPMRGLLGPSETAARLRRVDVVLTGHAYAPGGAATLPVTLRIARGSSALLDKTVHVIGDRSEADAEPAPFKTMALGYERALGGMGFDRNPFGVGLGGRGKPPNVVDPADPSGTAAGFGPIPRAFPVRRALLGELSAKEFERRVAEIPEGFDWDYFQCAPDDQQLESLRGTEWLELTGLHPRLLELRTQLPALSAELELGGADGGEGTERLKLKADLLHIDTDRQRCGLLWRADAPLGSLDVLEAVRLRGRLRLDGQLVTKAAPIDAPSAKAPVSVPALASLRKTGMTGTVAADSKPPPASADLGAPFEISQASAADAPDSRPRRAVPGAPWARSRSEPQPPAPVPQARAAPEPGVSAALGRAVAARVRDMVEQSAPRASREAATQQVSAKAREAATERQAVQLLWFDPERCLRVRTYSRWREIVDALDDEPVCEDMEPSEDDPHELGPEVFEVLVRGTDDLPVDRYALLYAVRDDGKLVPPLLLGWGELALRFDPLPWLELALSLVAPFAKTDAELQKTAETVRAFTSSDAPLPGPLADSLRRRLAEAFAKAEPSLGELYVDTHASRSLLEARRYSQRVVFGEPHICARLRPERGTEDEPGELSAYLPATLAESLPLFQRIDVRLIAELHERQEPDEPSPLALRIIALARTEPLAHSASRRRKDAR